VAVKKHYATIDLEYAVEFREAIAGMIPMLIKRLEDEGKDIRLEIVEVLGELANHGKSQLNSFYSTANTDYRVELRGLIAPTIPLLIKRLKDKDKVVGSAVAKLINKLANRGE